MNLKKSAVIATITILIGSSGYGLYKSNEATNNIEQLKQETSVLKKQNKQLTKINTDSRKELEHTKDSLNNSKKEIAKLKKEDQTTIDNQPKLNNQTTQKELPANTDYMTEESRKELEEFSKKENERIAKEQVEKENKENQPQYATYTENSRSPYHFATENNISLNELYELNPGADFNSGNSYRIK